MEEEVLGQCGASPELLLAALRHRGYRETGERLWLPFPQSSYHRSVPTFPRKPGSVAFMQVVNLVAYMGPMLRSCLGSL